MNLLKNNKGFKLIELMLIIAIIGLLAAIVIPQLQKQREQQAEERIKIEQEKVQKAELEKAKEEMKKIEKKFKEEYCAYTLNEFILKYPQYLVLMNDDVIYKQFSQEEFQFILDKYSNQKTITIGLDTNKDPKEVEYKVEVTQWDKYFLIGESGIYVELQTKTNLIMFYVPKENAQPLPTPVPHGQIKKVDGPKDELDNTPKSEEPPKEEKDRVMEYLKNYK